MPRWGRRATEPARDATDKGHEWQSIARTAYNSVGPDGSSELRHANRQP